MLFAVVAKMFPEMKVSRDEDGVVEGGPTYL